MTAALGSAPTEVSGDANVRAVVSTAGRAFSAGQDLRDRAGRTHDYAEGVRAFLGKRAARFEGR